MTKVEIMPGPCGFLTTVTAEKTGVKVRGHVEVEVHVTTECKSVNAMMEALGDKFDSQKICLVHPGEGPLNDYAKVNFPVHVACPVLAGITKCVEGESGLGLKKDAYIRFIEQDA